MSNPSFSVYDIAIAYPQEWRVSLEHKSDFDHGGFDILEPRNCAMVTVLWRSKEQLIKSIRGKGAKREFLKLFSRSTFKGVDLENTSLLDAYRKMLWHKLRKSVKNVELLSTEEVEINGHRAYFEQIIFKPATKIVLLKRISGIIRRIQLLLICDETDRTFAVFGSTLDSDFKEFEEILNKIVLSFRCHVK